MNHKKFAISFFLFAIGLFVIASLYVSYLDSHRVFNLPWQYSCKEHKNDALKKLELLNAYDSADAIVVGASTAELYMPADIHKFFDVKTYNTTWAGAYTPGRFALIKRAIEKYDLKYIFYISDFYEFNWPRAATKVYYNKTLNSYLPEDLMSQMRPSIKKRIWDLISHQSIESATDYLKNCLKGKVNDYYKADGTTTISMVLNGVDKLNPADPEYELKLNKELNKHITLHYSGALPNYTELSPTVKELYRKIVAEAKQEGAQLFFILSPYHPKFHQRLEQEGLVQLRKQWREFVKSLRGPNVIVFDQDDEPLYPGNARFWQDGHHPTREAAYLTLEKLSEIRETQD